MGLIAKRQIDAGADAIWIDRLYLLFVYIDYGMHDNLPLAMFSQKLTSKKQSEFLMEIDEFANSERMIFTYPAHGFYTGQNAKILSFGKVNWYDSLAPEFQTYKTIKELALKKK